MLPRLDTPPLSHRTEPDLLNGVIWRCKCGTAWTLHYYHALDYQWGRTSRRALRKLKR